MTSERVGASPTWQESELRGDYVLPSSAIAKWARLRLSKKCTAKKPLKLPHLFSGSSKDAK